MKDMGAAPLAALAVVAVGVIGAGAYALNRLATDAEASKKRASGGLVPGDGTAPPSGSIEPEANPLTGPMLPYRGRILLVGGRLALGIAQGLKDELSAIEAESGLPVTPHVITIWDGADIPAQIEATASALKENGLPPEAALLDGQKPDVVILAMGDYNAMWGPVDPMTDQAMVGLTKVFAGMARQHFPNVLWVAPWNQDTQPNARELMLRMGAATLSAVGRAAMLVPQRLLVEMTSDPIVPTAKGYREIAHEAAVLLLKNGPAAQAALHSPA